jgi:hypothetical protein
MQSIHIFFNSAMSLPIALWFTDKKEQQLSYPLSGIGGHTDWKSVQPTNRPTNNAVDVEIRLFPRCLPPSSKVGQIVDKDIVHVGRGAAEGAMFHGYRRVNRCGGLTVKRRISADFGRISTRIKAFRPGQRRRRVRIRKPVQKNENNRLRARRVSHRCPTIFDDETASHSVSLSLSSHTCTVYTSRPIIYRPHIRTARLRLSSISR